MSSVDWPMRDPENHGAVNYFLIAVSTRHNLEQCLRYALAGFTSSASGLWTYLDIAEGDYVSFLYGARVFNLYQVERKSALADAQDLPPWPALTLQPSGRTYYFPFRLYLCPVRTLEESLVRLEFAYVAENLLLRGGYRKTHFQADQTTLQAVSQMGRVTTGDAETLALGSHATFTPRLARGKKSAQPPEIFPFQELFLQALVRKHLGDRGRMQRLIANVGAADLFAEDLEVLSEKAFPEGHVDLLIKESTPRGISRKVIIELKNTVANERDVAQLMHYRDSLGPECVGAALVSRGLTKKASSLAKAEGIASVPFRLDFPTDPATFESLGDRIRLDMD